MGNYHLLNIQFQFYKMSYGDGGGDFCTLYIYLTSLNWIINTVKRLISCVFYHNKNNWGKDEPKI